MRWTKQHDQLLTGILAINLLWEILERLFYGHITPQPEDTIVAMAWTAFVVLAYKQGKKDGKEDWHGT